MAPAGPSALSGLECGDCGRVHDARRLQGLCTRCRRPLLARYDLQRAARTLTRESLGGRAAGLWRWREVLPAAGEAVSLGEGGTPLLDAPRLAVHLGLERLRVKDESVNPTGSFKARGMSAAVTRARELGATRLAAPTAGNAGVALAAYAAAAGLPADVFCPADTPPAFLRSMEILGARVHRVDGLIDACGARVRDGLQSEGWMDLSTLREPYRLEGKKTMGYELAADLGWRLPDVILYPTGGGTGLIGMWKAFDEMQELGWIGRQRPRMIAVQAEGCAPIVRAFRAGEATARPWKQARTVASGLRVPAAVGDALMLRTLRESGGTAVAVSDTAMVDGARLLGSLAGVLAAPEGGALVAALAALLADGTLDARDNVVLFNTGSALTYLDAFTDQESGRAPTPPPLTASPPNT